MDKLAAVIRIMKISMATCMYCCTMHAYDKMKV